MPEKKSQALVRAEPEELAKWKEAATISGVSLNQWMVDSANRRLVQNDVGAAIDAFASTSTSAVATVTAPDLLLTFDVALAQTPILTGMRKWCDPEALRENIERLMTPDAG